ncbi:uncharacterized protein PHALS_12897 [Plasmopara halstedii]|uniref:Uncharacterized protein n=1 Tax=Plasmopara halstedii TaxID=4781 RepID=A0A0P1APF1_PLAHL|nr:uncharacterized protein PHALS_12897 [Plasmopara halstedii]CEG42639.1 hypothetical protein PHALS_12897 [Plasmopara halstedii]|eukprot:XP_024579008.1 hypothetical protein PHALS_12897 [Plasmopara halstedii]
MTDVHGELLKCVLQLAACSDKLRAADVMLGKYVNHMQQDLPASGMPRLTSKLAVVPAHPVREALTLEEKYQEAYEQGMVITERLEVTKSRLEKELRRRSENFRDLVKSRNTDIQEEYARMLQELDDQVESLGQEITKEKDVKADRAKRQREEALQWKANKLQHLEAESTLLKTQLNDFTTEIRELQQTFATLEKEDENEENENALDNVESAEERRRLEEERDQNEIIELEQEIVLLKEARDAIADKIDKKSLKAQYEEEKQEIVEEIAHLKSSVEDFTAQINSSGSRLDSLLRTLAPSPGIGTLMTRLYQQLRTDTVATSSSNVLHTSRKTVDLKSFLNSCPTYEEGNQAIEELKKLQLIYCYESSGIIARED